MVTPTKLLLMALLGFSLAACDHTHEHTAPMPEEVAPPTNRTDVPLSVRQNLGVTFARVERRAVAATVRYPGTFELRSTARRHYIAPAAGRVEIIVEDYQKVEPGTILFRITSPDWKHLQQQMVGAILRADAMKSQLEAHEGHRSALQDKLRFWQERLDQLDVLRESDAVQWGEISHAQQNIATSRAEIADAEEKRYEVLREAVPYLGADGKGDTNPTFDLALNNASNLLGMDVEELMREMNGEPRWRTINSLEVLATHGGRIEPIPVTSGALIEEGSLVVTITDPSQLRFRAKGLQSDLAKLRHGSAVHVVPLGTNQGEIVEGTLMFGLEADVRQRTIDLIIDLQDPTSTNWARPGVAAMAEVVVDGGGTMELAVPQRAIITDGLQRILFRRAPDNPDQVIRLEADAGVSDGDWVEILSGLAEGDEVVLGGVYELMLGSSTDGMRQQGGHFHADGTFHEAH
jgi:hypothetical protein